MRQRHPLNLGVLAIVFGFAAALAIIACPAHAADYVPNPAVSCAVLDNTNNAPTCAPMDLTAQAFTPAGMRADQATYERRYGVGTFGPRFKRWPGPNNEVRFVVVDALTERLGRVPLEQEVTDAQACGDRLWVSYIQAHEAGFSPARRIHVNKPERPHGDFEETNPFWGLPNYYFNDANGVPAPAACAPPKTCQEPCETCPSIPPACAPLPKPLRETIAKASTWTILTAAKKQRLSEVARWAESCPR